CATPLARRSSASRAGPPSAPTRLAFVLQPVSELASARAVARAWALWGGRAPREAASARARTAGGSPPPASAWHRPLSRALQLAPRTRAPPALGQTRDPE